MEGCMACDLTITEYMIISARQNADYFYKSDMLIAKNCLDENNGNKAKYGWYRYDTRFGIPVYNENGDLERYNIFAARLLIRCDEDGKLYLYDIVRIKKETSKPH